MGKDKGNHVVVDFYGSKEFQKFQAENESDVTPRGDVTKRSNSLPRKSIKNLFGITGTQTPKVTPLNRLKKTVNRLINASVLGAG